MMTELFECLKNVKPGAWVRLALLLALLANTVLAALGKSPVSLCGDGAETAAALVTAAAALVSYWKNNSFTRAAQVADEVLRQLKEEKIR